MKIRNGFVTNSSSSSFIIKSKKEAPEDIKKHFTQITKDNFEEQYLGDMSEYYIDSHLFSPYDEEEEERMRKLIGLTQEQVTLLILNKHDLLEEFLDLKEEVNKMSDNEFLYYLYADRDWLYYQDAIKNFIKESEVLEHKTDL